MNGPVKIRIGPFGLAVIVSPTHVVVVVPVHSSTVYSGHLPNGKM